MSVDPRFYQHMDALSLAEIANILGGSVSGDAAALVSSLSAFETSTRQDVCFLSSEAFLSKASEAGFGLCLTTAALAPKLAHLGPVMQVKNPEQAFYALAHHLVKRKQIFTDGDSDRAHIHQSAKIGPNVTLGPNVSIGAHTQIEAGAVIAQGVEIGAHCRIGAQASIAFALIADHVHIQAGARIGEEGFGLIHGENGPQNIPHFGRVIVHDNVWLGANSCIDRGVLGDTHIGMGSKIDNMCHIGHNTELGQHVVMAAYGGISGSVSIGDRVQMGGRVGIVDHVRIGADAKIAAGTNVNTDIPAGEVWAGSPAQPIQEWRRSVVWLKRQSRKSRSHER